MQVNFKFEPMQKVILTAYGLNFRARILACIVSAGGVAYRLEYSEDGSIEEGVFYEDDLELDCQ